MADVFRQQIVSYHTPDGKRCKASDPGAVRTVTESKKWCGNVPKPGGGFPRKRLSERKETARRMLLKLRNDGQMESVGLGDPFREHRLRPIGEHLEDFRRYLAAKGRCNDHIRNTFSQCRAVIDGREILN